MNALEPDERCTQKEACVEIMRLSRQWFATRMRLVEVDTPLWDEGPSINGLTGLSLECFWCRRMLDGLFDKLRRKFWKALPEELGVETPANWDIGQGHNGVLG